MVPLRNLLSNRPRASARVTCALPGLLLLLSACAGAPPPPAKTESPKVTPKSSELATVPALVAPMPGAVASAAIVSSRRSAKRALPLRRYVAADSRATIVLMRHCCKIESTVFVN